MRNFALPNWSDYLNRGRETEECIIRDSEKSLLETRKNSRVSLPAFTVEFKDEFAPGTFDVRISDPKFLSRAGRSVLYGSNWHEIAYAAIEWVADRGFPSLMWPDLNTYSPVDETALAELCAKLGSVVEKEVEGSEDWLCYLIYLQLLSISNLYTTNASQHLIFDSVFTLGGLVRELELSHLNKQDALTRKKAKKALAEANNGRDAINAERKLYAKEWRRHATGILSKLDGKRSASAVADHILARWDEGDFSPPPRKPAKGTVQNWLSEK